MQVTITEYLDTPVTKPRAVGQLVTLPWPNLLAHLLSRIGDQRAKGAAGYWVAAPVPGPRSNAAAQPTRVVALDWDDAPVDWDALLAHEYFAHTTDSHTEAEPRWRVWVLLDREYSADEVGRAVCPWPGAHLRAISQPAYIPTMGDDVEYDGNPGGHRRGPLVLSTWWPAVALATPFVPPATKTRPSASWVNAFVARVVGTPERTNDCFGACGAALAASGWTNEEIGAALDAWFTTYPLGRHRDSALRAADKRRADDRVPCFPRLVELGIPWAVDAPVEIGAEEILALLAEEDANAGAERPARLGSTEPPFHWATGDQMLDYQLPEIQWLVEALSFAPGAPGLCTGYSGTGKTTTLQDLALSVATPGRRFLNHFEVRHGRVAHIDLEQGTQQTVRTYRALGLERGAELVCSVLPSWRLTDADSIKALAREARGRALIIIDSFRVACLGVDENSSDFAEPLGVLGQISEATGCAFMLNHHSGKGHQDTPHMSARGSSAITAAVSVHWSFERKPLTPDVRPCLQIVKSRNHQTPNMVWKSWVEMIDAGGGGFSLHARNDAGAPAVDDAADLAIIQAVSDANYSSVKALIAAAGIGTKAGHQAIKRALRTGAVVHQNGSYVKG